MKRINLYGILTVVMLIMLSIGFTSCGDDTDDMSTTNIPHGYTNTWSNLEGVKLYLNMKVVDSHGNQVNKGEYICYKNGVLVWNNKADGNSQDVANIEENAPNILKWTKQGTTRTLELLEITKENVKTKGPDNLTREWRFVPCN